MSFLSNVIKKAAPIIATVAPGTAIGTAAAVVSAEQARADASYRRKLAEQKRKEVNMEFMGSRGSSIPTITSNLARTTPVISTASSGGGFFDTLRSGLRETGGFVNDLFFSGLPQLAGINRPTGLAQGPAITTTSNFGAQESQGSGTIEAGFGSALAPIVSGTKNLLRSPLGQIALGGGSALALSGGQTMPKTRITRKMKSQSRLVLNLANGNLSIAADMLNISEDMLVTILLKRFRNDGPVVTKAALRKTKQTVRRLKSMCDMYDSLRPSATRRRTPMRRASTTLISNK
jgi:hypothetical protein